ncbi:MAG: RecX family transcriptional regulator [Anaerolineae bacterium]
MPRITHLQLQERRTDRVNVFLADEYAFSLVVDLAVRLKVDQDLTEADIDALRSEDAYRVSLDRALRWLAVRPRSRADLERHLGDKDVPPAIVARVADRLLELGYLDDLAFARWWVDNRGASRPRGRQMLRHELSAHGVAPDIIAEVTRDVAEPDAAVALALAQVHRFATDDRAVFTRRLGSYLSRRGFEYGAVREALAAAWSALSESSGARGEGANAADGDGGDWSDEGGDAR